MRFDDERKDWRSEEHELNRVIEEERVHVADRDERIRQMEG